MPAAKAAEILQMFGSLGQMGQMGQGWGTDGEYGVNFKISFG